MQKYQITGSLHIRVGFSFQTEGRARLSTLLGFGVVGLKVMWLGGQGRVFLSSRDGVLVVALAPFVHRDEIQGIFLRLCRKKRTYARVRDQFWRWGLFFNGRQDGMGFF